MKRVDFVQNLMLVSDDPERLVGFYRDVLGLPFVAVEDEGVRWGCSLGGLELSIHAPADFDDPAVGVGAVRFGFAVPDIDATVATLEELGIELSYPPRDLGWGKTTAVRDPDGNVIELTELGDDWYRHLEKESPPARSRRVHLRALDD